MNIWKAKLNKEQNQLLINDIKCPSVLKTAAFFSAISGEFTQWVNDEELVFLNDKFEHNFPIELIQ